MAAGGVGGGDGAGEQRSKLAEGGVGGSEDGGRRPRPSGEGGEKGGEKGIEGEGGERVGEGAEEGGGGEKGRVGKLTQPHEQDFLFPRLKKSVVFVWRALRPPCVMFVNSPRLCLYNGFSHFRAKTGTNAFQDFLRLAP